MPDGRRIAYAKKYIETADDIKKEMAAMRLSLSKPSPSTSKPNSKTNVKGKE